MNKTFLIWAITLFLPFSLSFGQKNGEPQETSPVQTTPLNFGNRHVFHSKILNESRSMDIYLPETYHDASSDHVYPVIVVLESEFFHVTTGIVKHLSSVSRMPEAIVVAFSGESEGFYAPSIYTNKSNNWPSDWEKLEFSGPAKMYVDFFSKELFPYLAKNYRTAKFRMIVGSSARAAFVLHAFAKEPALFQAHIAISAGDILGMGYQPGQCFNDLFVESMTRTPNRKGYLYVASSDSDVDYAPEIGTNLVDLEKRLSPFRSKNLRFKSEVIPNETHYGSYLKAFTTAMEVFFPIGKWAPEFQEFEKPPGPAIDKMDSFYKKLSADYGFSILPKAEKWNSGNSVKAGGRRLLRAERYEEAIQYFKRLVQYRPRSASALKSLADAYEAHQNLEQAIITGEKAVALAKRHDKKNLTLYEDNLKKLKGKLEESKK